MAESRKAPEKIMTIPETIAAITEELRAMGWDKGMQPDTVKRDAAGNVIATRESNDYVRDVEEASDVVNARNVVAGLASRSQ